MVGCIDKIPCIFFWMNEQLWYEYHAHLSFFKCHWPFGLQPTCRLLALLLHLWATYPFDFTWLTSWPQHQTSSTALKTWGSMELQTWLFSNGHSQVDKNQIRYSPGGKMRSNQNIWISSTYLALTNAFVGCNQLATSPNSLRAGPITRVLKNWFQMGGSPYSCCPARLNSAVPFWPCKRSVYKHKQTRLLETRLSFGVMITWCHMKPIRETYSMKWEWHVDSFSIMQGSYATRSKCYKFTVTSTLWLEIALVAHSNTRQKGARFTYSYIRHITST